MAASTSTFLAVSKLNERRNLGKTQTRMEHVAVTQISATGVRILTKEGENPTNKAEISNTKGRNSIIEIGIPSGQS